MYMYKNTKIMNGTLMNIIEYVRSRRRCIIGRKKSLLPGAKAKNNLNTSDAKNYIINYFMFFTFLQVSSHDEQQQTHNKQQQNAKYIIVLIINFLCSVLK